MLLNISALHTASYSNCRAQWLKLDTQIAINLVTTSLISDLLMNVVCVVGFFAHCILCLGATSHLLDQKLDLGQAGEGVFFAKEGGFGVAVNIQ